MNYKLGQKSIHTQFLPFPRLSPLLFLLLLLLCLFFFLTLFLSVCLSLSLFLVSFCVLGTLNKYAKMSASMKPPHYTHHPEKSHRDSNTKEHQFFISAVSITKHMKKDACKVILVIATIWLQFFEILWIRTTQFSCSWILDKYCPNQWVWVKFVIDGHVMLVEIKWKIQSLERHYSCIELEKA